MTSQPIIIFGTGGSGTRVVARIIQETGCFLGSNLNYALDALEITKFLDKWANQYLSRSQWFHTTDKLQTRLCHHTIHNTMIQDLKQAVMQHKIGISSHKWGFKSPRSIYILPFLHYQYPEIQVIHIVRNGLDMAYSTNQNQLDIHGGYILDKDRINNLSIQELSIALWSKVNLAATNYGKRYLGDKYLRIRFEDLCQKPSVLVKEIEKFYGTISHYDVLEIVAPETIGKWKKKDQKEIKDLTFIGEKGLRRFEYL